MGLIVFLSGHDKATFYVKFEDKGEKEVIEMLKDISRWYKSDIEKTYYGE